jgi:hypothetical protein
LESLGLESRQLNELNDSYEVENLWKISSRCFLRTTNPCLYSQINTIKINTSQNCR